MHEDKFTSNTKQLEIDGYNKLEIEEILARTRALQNIRIQIFTFFGTANLTVLGFALSTQWAGLIFVATGIMVLLAVSDWFLRRQHDILYFRGLQLEKKYAPDGETALLHTLVAVGFGHSDRVKEFTTIANIESKEERVKALRTFRFALGFWIPAVIALIEVGVAIVLWLSLGWKLF
jgi:hypothetical protein